MDKPIKLWQTIVASAFSSVIGGLIILLFTRAGQHYDNNEAALSKKADIEYVDKQDKQIRDAQSAHEFTDEQKQKILMEYLQTMNTNISDIKADIRAIKNK